MTKERSGFRKILDWLDRSADPSSRGGQEQPRDVQFSDLTDPQTKLEVEALLAAGSADRLITLMRATINATGVKERHCLEWVNACLLRNDSEGASLLLRSLDPTEATLQGLLRMDALARRNREPDISMSSLREALRRFPKARSVILRILNNIGDVDHQTQAAAFAAAKILLSEPEKDAELAVAAANAADRPIVRNVDRDYFDQRCDAALRDPAAPALWRAQRLFSKGQLEDAAACLDAHLSERPDDIPALRLRIRISTLQGQWGRDAALLMRAQSDPEKWPLLSEKGAAVSTFFRTEGLELADAIAGESKPLAITSPVDVVRAVCRQTPAPTETGNGRVLMIAESLYPGGAEKILASLYAGLVRAVGDRVSLFLTVSSNDTYRDPLYCLGAGNADLKTDVGFLDWTSRPLTDDYISALPLHWDRMAQSIYDKIIELRPSTVYASLDYINILTALAALRAGVPRIVLHVHNIRTTSILERPGIEATFAECYRALADRPEVRLVSCSDAVARDYHDWCALSPKHEITTVHYGYQFPDRDQYPLAGRPDRRRAFGLPPVGPIVGGAMRLSWVKRPFRWIEVAGLIAEQCPTAHFAIFGDGELADEARAKVAEVGLSDKVTFVNWVSDIYAAMSCLDVFMHSSVSEGFGNVLVEAQACGVPPVAYDVGGCRETMIPGVTGKIVEEDSAEALAAAALEALNDAEWRATATRAGPDFVRTKFDEARMIGEFRDILLNAQSAS